MTIQGDPEAPATILNDLLEQTRVAMQLNRFDLFAPHVSLPFKMVTRFGTRVLDTPLALHQMFRQSMSFYRQTGVRDVVRYCLEADQSGPDQITGLYETRLIHSFQRLEREPYDVLTKLERGPHGWGFAYCDYAVQDCDAQLRMLAQCFEDETITTPVSSP